jgi:hypothetical protein
MKVAMVRVGIDTGSGGAHGPLFRDGSFEFIPIRDDSGIDHRTYSNTSGRRGNKLVEFLPRSLQARMANQSMHVDPEFSTFTYGDPTRPKAGLRHLQAGDMLVFYCGLQGWDFESLPALYLIGYFEVKAAGRAEDFSERELSTLFSENFHVRHRDVFEQQKDSLVLVKGCERSRLLNKAVLLSTTGQDRLGKPLKILSPDMREVFGSFGGKLSIQRSPTRWVEPSFTRGAAQFMRSLD